MRPKIFVAAALVVAAGTVAVAAASVEARATPPARDPFTSRTTTTTTTATIATTSTVPTNTVPVGPTTTSTTVRIDAGPAALALIAYPWAERLHATITFAGPRAGMRAQSTAYAGRSVVTIFVRPTDTAQMTAVNIAHELGHLIDWYLLTDLDRAQWSTTRGRPGATWWACDYCADYGTGSGDFAETFAAWAVAPIDYRSVFAPLPTPSQMTDLSRFFK